ncbi:hypothetical protein DVH24_007145 [Malus domestica]|uniref:Protein kinase domain-containing protein n=1 Tax=Malus domestica TaxID=3750 RepID=A0A498HFV9_MALDO|nr:hypothetical protein DVH24_007145 [Malus domestica]
MGNCCLRKHHGETDVSSVVQPHPIGDIRLQISLPKKTNKAVREKAPTVSSTSLQGQENMISKREKRRSPLQERNFSVSDIGAEKKRSKSARATTNSNTPSPKDWNLERVNKKDGVLRDYRLYCFCYSALKASTRKFSSKNLIGQGGFGDVYKGYVSYCNMNAAAKPSEGFPIAVKRLRKTALQGDEQWENERKFMSKLSHPNIVKLIGYCREGEHRMLVYEYMKGGSLEAQLMAKNATQLHWRRRTKLALGVAKALHCLHTRGAPVIHRDLKASNVLLDDVRLWHVTLKTDVYSFGVVLLEIFSGSCAVKKYSDGMTGDLTKWAEPYLRNRLQLHRVIDQRLGNNFPVEEAHKFAELILRCLDSNPKSRPTMTEVVADLEELHENTGSNRISGHVTKWVPGI